MVKYNVIYADPPWSYKEKKSGYNYKHGAADKYPIMFNEDIMAMPINDLCEKNAVTPPAMEFLVERMVQSLM